MLCKLCELFLFTEERKTLPPGTQMYAMQTVRAVFCSLKNAKLYHQEPRCMLCKLCELFLFTEERKTLQPGTQMYAMQTVRAVFCSLKNA